MLPLRSCIWESLLVTWTPGLYIRRVHSIHGRRHREPHRWHAVAWHGVGTSSEVWLNLMWRWGGGVSWSDLMRFCTWESHNLAHIGLICSFHTPPESESSCRNSNTIWTSLFPYTKQKHQITDYLYLLQAQHRAGTCCYQALACLLKGHSVWTKGIKFGKILKGQSCVLHYKYNTTKKLWDCQFGSRLIKVNFIWLK